MIEHCVSALKQKAKETTYRVYLTDGIKCISETLAKKLGGAYIPKRYADMIEVKKQDTRTGDEIALDIINRAGLRLSDGFTGTGRKTDP